MAGLIRGYFSRACVTLLILSLSNGSGWAFDSGDLQAVHFRSEDKTVHCERLKADITIRVLIPDSYQWDDESYIGVYTMDQRADDKLAACISSFMSRHEEVLPMLIVRLPEAVVQLTQTENTDKAFKVLNESVTAYVKEHYRLIDYQVLAGEQLDSLTALRLAEQFPGMFQGVIAEKPAGSALGERDIEKLLTSFASSDDEQPMTVAVATTENASDMKAYTLLNQELKKSGSDRVRFLVQNIDLPEGEKKAGILMHEGLAFCFADWKVTDRLIVSGLNGTKRHYEQLSTRYGVTCPVPQTVLYKLAYYYAERNSYEKLIRVLKFNVDQHPNSARAQAALGQGWELRSEIEKSAMYYKKAVSIAKRVDSPFESDYRAFLDEATRRMLFGATHQKHAIIKPSSTRLVFGPQSHQVY